MISAALMPMLRLVNSASWMKYEAVIDPDSVKLELSADTEGSSVYQARATYSYTASDGQVRYLKISNVNSKVEKTEALYIHAEIRDAILLTEHLETPEQAAILGEFITSFIHSTTH